MEVAAEVEDGFGLGGDLGEGVQVGHEVVTDAGFLAGGFVEIDVVEVGLHFVELIVGDGEAEGFFGFGECEPDAAPGGVLAALGGEDGDHLGRGVARDERGFVDVIIARGGGGFGHESTVRN